MGGSDNEVKEQWTNQKKKKKALSSLGKASSKQVNKFHVTKWQEQNTEQFKNGLEA